MPELSDEAKAEIRDAIAIVASDKGTARLKAIHDHLIPATPETEPPKDGDPNPPPKKEKPPEGEPVKKGSIWAVGSE